MHKDSPNRKFETCFIKDDNESREILRLLDRTFRQHEIRYAIIGAYAVAAWGNLRATRDIDLLAEPPNVERLEQALATAKLDFEIRTGDATDPIFRVDFGQLKSHEWARM